MRNSIDWLVLLSLLDNGQTLSGIAAQTGSSQKLLMSVNHIENPRNCHNFSKHFCLIHKQIFRV
jgi:hypothetical protein